MRRIGLAVGWVLLAAGPLAAQETFRAIEYVSGTDEIPHGARGNLILSDSTVVFAGGDAGKILVIPLARITAVTSSADDNTNRLGAMDPFDLFARTDGEFVYLDRAGDAGLQELVFKTGTGKSRAVAAGIRAAMQQCASPGTAQE